MSFISFLSVILDQKSVDLVKIIEFQNQEIVVLKAMLKTGRKIPNLREKRLLSTLAYEIRHILKLGKLITIFKPETILKWYRQFANQKFDSSKNSQKKGRPETDEATAKLIIKMTTENKSWGADRSVGAFMFLCSFNTALDKYKLLEFVRIQTAKGWSKSQKILLINLNPCYPIVSIWCMIEIRFSLSSLKIL